MCAPKEQGYDTTNSNVCPDRAMLGLYEL